MIRGSATALATPFLNGEIDESCLVRLCERQIDRGTTALVVCGSTGEAAALRPEEHALVVRVAVMAAAGRVPVIAGCGASSTAGAAELAGAATRNGADGLLCAPPPYVRPTQDGIVGHLRMVRNASDLPVMLYDVPGRTGVAVGNDTVARLFAQGLIFGIKDATADLARPARLRSLCGHDFVQMTGDDSTAGAYRAMGGHGCISVIANIAPTLCSLLHRSWDGGDLAAFVNTRDRLAQMSDLLFSESNPIPLKAAMSMLGLCDAELRLPLTPASHATRDRLAVPLATLASLEEALAARARYALAS
jgi:4-hydroxy-tetrahydrodipicolinate synthase